jgi:tetratricopeptide (TPR) repeat protein
MSSSPSSFLDVPALLELSQPRARHGWFRYAIGIFLLLVLGSAYARSKVPQGADALIELLSAFVMLGLIGVMIGYTMTAVRGQRAEQGRLEAIEELVQLRRWPEAAAMLDQLLSTPTRSPQARVQALIYLTSVLARYHRFADAILVQNHLLEHVLMDEGTSHALRLGRAMAMLREDHLFDADRAISELRRTPGAREESAGLALVEIYRDVKTGHPEEAIEIFNERLPVLRQQLGNRVADAYALAAKAYDLLSRETEAAKAFDNATLLSPVDELSRRYPEFATIAQKYTPATMPT